jgi:hypothetical protein
MGERKGKRGRELRERVNGGREERERNEGEEGS